MSCAYFTVTWEIQNSELLLEDEACYQSRIFKMETTSNGTVLWMMSVQYNYNTDSFTFILKQLRGNLKNVECQFLIDSKPKQIASMPDDNGDSFRFTGERNTIFGSQRNPKPLSISCRIGHKTVKSSKRFFEVVLKKAHFVWDSPYDECEDFPDTIYYYDDMQLNMSKSEAASMDNQCRSIFSVDLQSSEYCSILKSKLSVLANGSLHGIQQTGVTTRARSSWTICHNHPKSHDGYGYSIQRHTSRPYNFKFIVAEEMISTSEYLQKPKSLPENLMPMDRKEMISTNECLQKPKSLTQDLMEMFRKKVFTDVILKAKDKSFSVHKNILAARSPVFCAMFESDKTTEGRSGVVDIDDLDDGTVDRMLVFMYSDALADLKWEEASKLYYAADKYAVVNLKQRCADILKDGLSESNACSALVLADTHSDGSLLESVVDFLSNHGKVLSSDEFEKLEDTNSRLTSKVMRKLYVKKEYGSGF